MLVSQTIGSLHKALDLIEALAEDGGEVGISDLARRLGLSKNQVFRIIKTLEEHDFVHQSENKAYRLGYKFLEIGQRLTSSNDLVQIALPLMEELRNATGETVHLFIRDGLRAVCVARMESPQLIRLSAQIGRRFLLHAGACPKAILAFQPESVFDAAIQRYGQPAYTEHTITDPDTLKAHLAEIRQRGFAESDEDLDPLAYAIAIPIRNGDGHVDGAMSVAGPIQRFTPENRARIYTLLAETCNRISTALGAPAAAPSPNPFNPGIVGRDGHEGPAVARSALPS